MKLGGGKRTSSGAAATVGIGPPACSASMSHLRSMLAFKLCANATAAMDTPGVMHSRMTANLNSALCRRRRRRPISSTPQVFMCPRKLCGHKTPTAAATGQHVLAGRLRYDQLGALASASAMQQLESIAAVKRTFGRHHQADVQSGGWLRCNRLQWVGQQTPV